MSFFARAVVSLLAGIGAGTIGFGVVWNIITRILFEDPGIGFTPWFLTSIFLPGTLVPLIVFHCLGERTHERAVTSNLFE